MGDRIDNICSNLILEALVDATTAQNNLNKTNKLKIMEV